MEKNTVRPRTESCGCQGASALFGRAKSRRANGSALNTDAGDATTAADTPPAQPPAQGGVSATSLDYPTAPSAATLRPQGFDFKWLIQFNNAAQSLNVFQRVEWWLEAFDADNNVLHSATGIAFEPCPGI